ncbi:MAG: alpha-amylase family glycosyl hydrolase, partial [Pirellulaceae bacterium]
MLTDVSAAPILQWFESDFGTMEQRLPDLFAAGYGAVWIPPPGRADSGNQSVGYDVYDRFDLGAASDPTLYGTRQGIETLAEQLHQAGINLHVDTVINHSGFSDSGTDGFVASGGYPGLAITLPNAVDGDYHSAFASGDIQGRLAGLVDINHSTNHQLIRHPVDASDANNIPGPAESHSGGRTANVPDPANRQFYPDRDADPIHLFDPVTGESNIAVYPFHASCDACGDPVPENAMGYLMRYLQWMVQDVGVDGFRIDAAKHVEGFVMDLVDRAVYRSNPRPLLDGSTQHVFSYSEVFTGDKDVLLSHVKKTINPDDVGRIGGNRDALDFRLFFALRDNLNVAGTTNAWHNIRDASMDVADDGLHNGSAGVMFVQSHDEHGPAELGNVAHAYMLMQPGNAVVYFNAQQFGDNREFPKQGRGDALGGVYGNTINRLVDIRNTHGRGNYQERWIDDQGIFVMERESSALIGLSNRGDGGFDQRSVQVALAPGTHLVELTGNAASGTVDPNDDISEVLTVSQQQKVDIRIPRNRNANGDFHGQGYVIYGLPQPQAPVGLEILGAQGVLAGAIPDANNFANGNTRLSDIHLVTADSFQARLQTQEVRLLGLDSLRDIFADGDSALLKLDGGVDINGNGSVDQVTPGDVSYGFEAFADKSSPLIGPDGIGGSRGDGQFLQTVDTTTLSEGVHFL